MIEKELTLASCLLAPGAAPTSKSSVVPMGRNGWNPKFFSGFDTIRRDPASSIHDMNITTSPNRGRYRVRGHALHHGQCHDHLHVRHSHRDHHGRRGRRGPHGRDPGTLTPSCQVTSNTEHGPRLCAVCIMTTMSLSSVEFVWSHQNSVKRDLASCPPCPPCPPCSPCSPWPPCPEPPFKNFPSHPSQPFTLQLTFSEFWRFFSFLPKVFIDKVANVLDQMKAQKPFNRTHNLKIQ